MARVIRDGTMLISLKIFQTARPRKLSRFLPVGEGLRDSIGCASRFADPAFQILRSVENCIIYWNEMRCRYDIWVTVVSLRGGKKSADQGAAIDAHSHPKPTAVNL